jgi:hypothetical protein
MSKQASLNQLINIEEDVSSEDFFNRIYNDLDEIVDSGKSYARVEEDFGSADVFVQTEDYNVFATQEGLTFHGVEHNAPYFSSEETTSGEVLNYLADIYGVEDWERELNWY